MKRAARTAANKALHRFGLEISHKRAPDPPEWRLPSFEDMGDDFLRLYQQLKPFTMTGEERMYALQQACRHIAQAGIAGDYVECGLWRGGSSMLAAHTFLDANDRRLMWLYDTYEGHVTPTVRDRNWRGELAADKLAVEEREAGAFNTWSYATLEDVAENMISTGYPHHLIRYVEGTVEDKIPAVAPERIALLRLDTDWYESTRHELEHLWPRLTVGGVLIVDDYGHWQGAREATDEFFDTMADRPLLHRIDYSGRIAVKTS